MSDNNHDKLCKKIAVLIAERQVLETQLMVIIRRREKVKEEIERLQQQTSCSEKIKTDSNIPILQLL